MRFDLDQFKAGMPATDEYGHDNYYVGQLPDGEMVVAWKTYFKNWRMSELSAEDMQGWTMKSSGPRPRLPKHLQIVKN